MDTHFDISFRPEDLHVEVTVSHARAHLPELLDEVRDGRTVYLTRYGKRLAALVAPDTAEQAERLEDAYWSGRAKAAIDSNASTLPWSQVLSEAEAQPARDTAPPDEQTSQ